MTEKDLGAVAPGLMTEEHAAQWRIDKTGWAAGPWMDEPDRIEWRGPRGMPCLIVRSRSGALCGYVGVSPGHPWHGKDGTALYEVEPSPGCHGGVTFTGKCMDGGPVCHVPRHGESPDVWWVGFDSAHYGDFIPSYTKRELEGDRLWSQDGTTYRSVGYVRREVESLAEQAINARLASGQPAAGAMGSIPK